MHLPLHSLPSPYSESLHMQVKLPAVFMQTAFLSQSCSPVSHSSMSTNHKKNCKLSIPYSLDQTPRILSISIHASGGAASIRERRLIKSGV